MDSCEAKNGTKAHKLLHAGTGEHQRLWQNGENNPENRGRKKKIITRKEYRRLVKKFEMEGLMAQKGLWNLVKEKIMKERGELPNEEGEAVREYKVMHEEDFWSNWLREDE